MNIRREIRAAISNAYYNARNAGQTMGAAADDATKAVLSLVEADVVPLIRQAVLDPGAFVPRGEDYDGNAYGERLDQWQDRAIQAALHTMKEGPDGA